MFTIVAQTTESDHASDCAVVLHERELLRALTRTLVHGEDTRSSVGIQKILMATATKMDHIIHELKRSMKMANVSKRCASADVLRRWCRRVLLHGHHAETIRSTDPVVTIHLSLSIMRCESAHVGPKELTALVRDLTLIECRRCDTTLRVIQRCHQVCVTFVGQ